MIVVRLAGGLGNQLFQMAAAITLSKQVNEPYYFYDGDLQNYATKRQPMLGKLFGSEIESIAPSAVIRFLVKYRLNKVLPFNWQVDNQRLEKIDKKGFYVLDDYFQLINFVEKGAHEVAAKIADKQRSNNRVLSVYRQLVADLPENEVVAIHVRRGDFLKPENVALYPTLDAGYYKKAIAQLPTAAKRIIEISESPVFDPSQFDNIELLNVKQFGLSDIEEFLLLASFKNMVLANSTFSFWAATCNYQHRNLYGPAAWANNTIENQHWQNNQKHFSIKPIG